MNIGKNIANLRKEKDMTQEELANLINVSPKTISSYETNRSLPNLETLILLAGSLNTDINNILGLDNNTMEELNKAYHKKNTKDTFIKVLLIIIIILVPVLFFWYAGYVSIAAIITQIIAKPGRDLTEIARSTLHIYTTFIYEYAIYLAIMVINYFFYKKKYKIPLFIINILILSIFIYDLIIFGVKDLNILVYPLSAIIGLIFAIKILINQKHP